MRRTTRRTHRHWLQYHNTAEMGPPGPSRDGEPFHVSTDKKVRNLEGDTVWLIAGEGSPRVYTLCFRFTVDDVAEDADPDFTYCLSGCNGRSFEPPVALNRYAWFQRLFRSTGHLAFGLTRLDDATVSQLTKLTNAPGPWADPAVGTSPIFPSPVESFRAAAVVGQRPDTVSGRPDRG
jgi:hypothetical protein